MRKTLSLTTILVALSWHGDVLSACGDKFFLVGRGDRFSRAYASLHPGDILVYSHGLAPTAALLRDARLHKHLARAGHRVTIADDPAALARALRSRRFDIVLTHLFNAPDLVTKVSSLPLTPTLVPVGADGDQLTGKEEQHRFALQLKVSDRINRFLSGIEDVMKARAGAGLWRQRG